MFFEIILYGMHTNKYEIKRIVDNKSATSKSIRSKLTKHQNLWSYLRKALSVFLKRRSNFLNITFIIYILLVSKSWKSWEFETQEQLKLLTSRNPWRAAILKSHLTSLIFFNFCIIFASKSCAQKLVNNGNWTN